MGRVGRSVGTLRFAAKGSASTLLQTGGIVGAAARSVSKGVSACMGCAATRRFLSIVALHGKISIFM